MSALVLTLIRFGFLVLLWLFVLAVLLTVRSDIFGLRISRRTSTPAPKASRRAAKAAKPAKAQASSASASAAQTPGLLVVTQGPLAGTQLSLTSGPIMVGRSPDSSLVLDDGYASARHARFYLDNGLPIVEDLNSTNGTWIRGVRINEPTPLYPGTEITIGKTVLELR